MMRPLGYNVSALFLFLTPFVSDAQEQIPSEASETKAVSLSDAREMVMTGSYKEAIEAFGILAKEPKTQVAATLVRKNRLCPASVMDVRKE